MEPSDSLKTSNIALIANRLKYWKFEIITTAEWESSQVSIGGINTKEIESLTLESKIIPGLFLQVKSWMLLVKVVDTTYSGLGRQDILQEKVPPPISKTIQLILT